MNTISTETMIAIHNQKELENNLLSLSKILRETNDTIIIKQVFGLLEESIENSDFNFLGKKTIFENISLNPNLSVEQFDALFNTGRKFILDQLCLNPSAPGKTIYSSIKNFSFGEIINMNLNELEYLIAGQSNPLAAKVFSRKGIKHTLGKALFLKCKNGGFDFREIIPNRTHSWSKNTEETEFSNTFLNNIIDDESASLILSELLKKNSAVLDYVNVSKVNGPIVDKIVFSCSTDIVNSMFISKAILGNKNLSFEALSYLLDLVLASNKTKEAAILIVNHEKCTLELLNKILPQFNQEGDVLNAIFGKDICSAEILSTYSSVFLPNYVSGLYSSYGIYYSQNNSLSLRKNIALNPNTPQKVLNNYSNHADSDMKYDYPVYATVNQNFDFNNFLQNTYFVDEGKALKKDIQKLEVFELKMLFTTLMRATSDETISTIEMLPLVGNTKKILVPQVFNMFKKYFLNIK
jgi:hypothetical protein